MLDDGTCLAVFSSYLKELNFITIYDPVLRSMKKEENFGSLCLNDVSIMNDIIVMTDYRNKVSKMVLMNLDLEIVKEVQNIEKIYSSNKSFIYASIMQYSSF